MANEYLERIITASSYNNKGTISCWYREAQNTQQQIFSLGYTNGGTDFDQIDLVKNSGGHIQFEQYGDRETASRTNYNVRNLAKDFIDTTSWYHLHIDFDMTRESAERARLHVNGERQDILSNSNPFSSGWLMPFMQGGSIRLGRGAGITQYGSSYSEMQLSDFYVVDGVALDPSVFAYKDGNRNNQWRPTHPKKVKAAIDQAGGFGLNGFYLPLNSNANAGYDFHTEWNSIYKLKSHLPQPQASAVSPNTLNTDTFTDYLVFAAPYKDNLNDLSGTINNSTTSKTPTASGSASISSAKSVYYGSSLLTDGDADYVTYGTSTDFDFGTDDFTIELWAQADSIATAGNFKRLINIGGGLANSFSLCVEATDEHFVFRRNDAVILESNAEVPIQQWNHFCAERYNGVMTLYLNGVNVAYASYTTSMNYGSVSPGFRVGANENDSSGSSWNGNIQDVRVYKGIAKYKGGFDVPRPFGLQGLSNSENRVSKDVSTNKFAILNHFDYQDTGTIDSGSLTCESTNNTRATIAVNSGKWYAEIRRDDAAGSVNHFGVASQEVPIGTSGWSTGDFTLWRQDGYRQHNGVQTQFVSSTYAQGDIISVMLDFDNEVVSFWKNGVADANFTNLAFPTNWYNVDGSFKYLTFITRPNPGCQSTTNFGQSASFVGRTVPSTTYADANGIGEFNYQPPAGFLALCEKNLLKPTVDPRDHFGVIPYTGTGTTAQSIKGLKFKPGLVWIKSRSFTNNHHLFDPLRGPNNILRTSTTSAQTTVDGVMSSFDDGGFTVSEGTGNNATNDDGSTFVAWCWKAGNTVETNTNGTVTSTVIANKAAGFSIVKYNTGVNPTDYNWGHGLDKAPEFILAKGGYTSDTYNWDVYHKDVGPLSRLKINSTGIPENLTGPVPWGDQDPSDTVVYQSNFYNNTNSAWYGDNKDVIAYCWHEVPGYSKIGIYKASTAHPQPGAFVYTGFKPAFVMYKNITDVQSYSSWAIHSNHYYENNPIKGDKVLYANRDYAEGLRGEGSAYVSGVNDINFLANGFSLIDGSSYEAGNNSASYIYIAFAESPFQNSNGR